MERGAWADTLDMRKHLRMTTILALASVAAAGCNLFNKATDSTSPTSPSSSTVSLEAFAGSWSSATSSTPATGCGNVKYTVTPVSATSANVTFAGTCASSIQLTGTGTGKVNGSALDWSAQGLVSQGGVNCPFTFTNGKAIEDAAGSIKVTYGGTVCGIPVSGTETVKK
ncbi:MAG: hypothetical protein IMZ74_05555 [Actinobacteria bacterium]|nr:hypothetical protein [Actinomycetota bacterium]